MMQGRAFLFGRLLNGGVIPLGLIKEVFVIHSSIETLIVVVIIIFNIALKNK